MPPKNAKADQEQKRNKVERYVTLMKKKGYPNILTNNAGRTLYNRLSRYRNNRIQATQTTRQPAFFASMDSPLYRKVFDAWYSYVDHAYDTTYLALTPADITRLIKVSKLTISDQYTHKYKDVYHTGLLPGKSESCKVRDNVEKYFKNTKNTTQLVNQTTGRLTFKDITHDDIKRVFAMRNDEIRCLLNRLLVKMTLSSEYITDAGHDHRIGITVKKIRNYNRALDPKHDYIQSYIDKAQQKGQKDLLRASFGTADDEQFGAYHASIQKLVEYFETYSKYLSAEIAEVAHGNLSTAFGSKFKNFKNRYHGEYRFHGSLMSITNAKLLDNVRHFTPGATDVGENLANLAHYLTVITLKARGKYQVYQSAMPPGHAYYVTHNEETWGRHI
jgi:hypothetical protein